MSKLKALTLSILCAALAISFYTSQNTLFTWIAGIAALLFFCIWTAKRNRDHSIIKKVRQERQATAHIAEATPPATSMGNQRLFVPPPLKEK